MTEDSLQERELIHEIQVSKFVKGLRTAVGQKERTAKLALAEPHFRAHLSTVKALASP